MSEGSVRVGVDVGGTFTDLVLVDDAATLFGKVPTTPDEPAEGVLAGFADILDRAGRRPGDVAHIVHGTTVVTNALIERKGARVGLITTAGFRDVLEVGRETRHEPYDVAFDKPPVLVPRRLRLGVPERVDADGEVRLALDEDAVRAAAAALRAGGVEAVAVMFLHSYRNPAHEVRAAAILAETWPEVPVTLSSAVAPELGEYERAVTAAANACVQPVTTAYLRGLEEGLRRAGVTAPLSLMLSSGGLTSVAEAAAAPIRLVESGPAAGAMAAAGIARRLGAARLLAFDMGGTTAKLSLIENAVPARERRFEAARVHRMRRGSGLPLLVPAVDLIEIGAGGGSIAGIDARGALRVGPESAGARPGPACYGRGGAAPTVTDADLMLGLLAPRGFLGGRLDLDGRAAADAVAARVAAPLGLVPDAAAHGIHALVNETMALAARTHAAEKGHDSSTFALLAFGGAGPVHACDLARRLGIGTVVVPPGAGVMSAIGMIVAPPMVDCTRTVPGPLADWDDTAIAAALGDLEAEARGRLRAMGVREADLRVERRADIRYRGQGHAVTVEVAEAAGAAIGVAFADTYARLFGRTVPGVPEEVVAWRVTASGPGRALPTPRLHASVGAARRRAALFGGWGWVRCPVFQRAALPPRFTATGPALVEEEETTTAVPPDAAWRVDDALNLTIDLLPRTPGRAATGDNPSSGSR